MSISNLSVVNPNSNIKIGTLVLDGSEVSYGNFIPTLSNLVNVFSITGPRCIYSKTGATYDVAFEAIASENVAVNPSSFEFELNDFPNISFASVLDAIGVGIKVSGLGIGVVAELTSVIGTNRLKLTWQIVGPTNVGEIAVQITFYQED